MSTAPATKRDLENFVNEVKALMRRRDRIARGWMVAILVLYFLALMAELWVMVGHKSKSRPDFSVSEQGPFSAEFAAASVMQLNVRVQKWCDPLACLIRELWANACSCKAS